jgi:hypothetical protein
MQNDGNLAIYGAYTPIDAVLPQLWSTNTADSSQPLPGGLSALVKPSHGKHAETPLRAGHEVKPSHGKREAEPLRAEQKVKPSHGEHEEKPSHGEHKPSRRTEE